MAKNVVGKRRLPVKTRTAKRSPARQKATRRVEYAPHKDKAPIVRDAVRTAVVLAPAEATLDHISGLDRELTERFRPLLRIEPALNRQLVSFQANKTRPSYRWYKFKEGFSASLIEYLLNHTGVTSGVVLDPFAGSGTTLFVGAEMGLDAEGIELLPIGQEVIADRWHIEQGFSETDRRTIKHWIEQQPWRNSDHNPALPELRITAGAYPQQTKAAIENYLAAMSQADGRVQAALKLALLSVLESASYTRKDGQYLRWDARSGRRQGARPFHKGPILSFDTAIKSKLQEILRDVPDDGSADSLFPRSNRRGSVRLLKGSVLDVLPTLPRDHYRAIITSPPYCNRYDYTRTYALELALLGVTEHGLSELRQRMLSCTVENRTKDLLKLRSGWQPAIAAADRQDLLQAILQYLDDEKLKGTLNNNGIPRMVRGYFYEMACVIFECARVLKPGAPMCMVNDNVRYAGASVSVDLILSDIAERLGFQTEEIMVLPNGKGNSSQQMGRHGREVLRKCVYVWRKNE